MRLQTSESEQTAAFEKTSRTDGDGGWGTSGFGGISSDSLALILGWWTRFIFGFIWPKYRPNSDSIREPRRTEMIIAL